MYSNLPGQKKPQPTFPIADLHCDTVIAMRRGYDIGVRHDNYHLDIPRMREGGVKIQVFATSCLLSEKEINSFDYVNSQLDLMHEQFARYPDQIAICTNANEIKRTIDSGKIAAVLAIEGGLALGNDISRVQYFYDRGVRIITIAHEAPTGWCANHKETDPGFHGLNDIGRKFIMEMNRLGIIVDLSHSADSTVEEVLKLSSAPVIASHSNARALCNHSRNLADDQIKTIAATGGLIGVTFVNTFLSEQYNVAYEKFWSTVSRDDLKRLLKLYSSGLSDEKYQSTLQKDFAFIIEGERKFEHLRASVSDVVDQIDYMVNLIGPDHVAIGSDFDGMSSTPLGLEDCSKLQSITVELAKRGYSDIDIQKISSGNFMRVFEQVCG